MKAIAAMALVSEVTPASIALSGMLIGGVLLFLGASGLIDRIARLVPQSVLAGLQLGLGLSLGWIALGLMQNQLLVGLVSLVIALAALRFGTHAALATLLSGLVLGMVIDQPGLPSLPVPAEAWVLGRIGTEDWQTAVSDLAIPQLALTLTNAVFLTALIAQDSFGNRAKRVTPRNLSLTSGAANLLLAPLGALPMCHGAGGVTAHHRFGARTGGAPIMLGAALLGLAVLPDHFRQIALTSIPAATLGALLLIVSIELAFSRRLIDARPSCRPVIAITALGTFFVNPLVGLILGTLAEILRKRIISKRRRKFR
jgi:MFS superfamily sulfate permease-like transporter